MATALPAEQNGADDVTKNPIAKVFTFKQQNASNNDVTDSDDEDVLKFKPTLIPRGVLLSCEIYLTRHQWNTLSVVGKRLQCAICDKNCEADEFFEHISSDEHKKKMELYEPLLEFGPSIIRKINNKYHCGLCSKFIKEHEENDHFLSSDHVRNQTTANIKYYELTDAHEPITYRNYDRLDSAQLNEIDVTIESRALLITEDPITEILKTIPNLDGADIDKTHGEVVIRPFDQQLVITKMAYNTIIVKDKAKCLLCDKEFNESKISEHLSKNDHNTAVVGRSYFIDYRNNLIRLVNKNYHCAICNIVLPQTDVLLDHIESLFHMVLLAKSVQKGKSNVKNNFITSNFKNAPFFQYYAKLPPSSKIKATPRLPNPVNRIPNVPIRMWRPMRFRPPNLPFPMMMPNFMPPNSPNFFPIRGPLSLNFNGSPPAPPPGFWSPNFFSPPTPNFQVFPVNGVDNKKRPEIEFEESDTDDSKSDVDENENENYRDKQHLDIYHHLVLRLEKEQLKSFFNTKKKEKKNGYKNKENGKKMNGHVYVQLQDYLFKIKMEYYNSLVKIDRRTKYCFVCSTKLKVCGIEEHLGSDRHRKNVNECKFSEAFWKHLVRVVEDNFHCGLCNLFIPKHKLADHIFWPTHVTNYQIALNSGVPFNLDKLEVNNIARPDIGDPPKREDLKLDFPFNSPTEYEERLLGTKFVMAGNKYELVGKQNWQGIIKDGIDFKCLVCDAGLTEEVLVEHLMSSEHGVNVEVPVLKDFTPNILRLVKNDKINCVTCNNVIPNTKESINDHVLSKEHLHAYQSSPIKVRWKD